MISNVALYWIETSFIVLAMSMLNRSRGNNQWLPHVRNVFWMWLFIPLMLISMRLDTWLALTWGLGWMIALFPGYMRWASLGQDTVAAPSAHRPLTWDEKIVDELGGRVSPYIGLFVRGVIWLIPLAVALYLQGANPIGLLFPAIGMLPCYLIGWKIAPVSQEYGLDVAAVAEPLYGALWGLAIVFM